MNLVLRETGVRVQFSQAHAGAQGRQTPRRAVGTRYMNLAPLPGFAVFLAPRAFESDSVARLEHDRDPHVIPRVYGIRHVGVGFETARDPFQSQHVRRGRQPFYQNH